MDLVRATGEAVKTGVSAAQTGAEYARAAYEQARPLLAGVLPRLLACLVDVCARWLGPVLLRAGCIGWPAQQAAGGVGVGWHAAQPPGAAGPCARRPCAPCCGCRAGGACGQVCRGDGCPCCEGGSEGGCGHSSTRPAGVWPAGGQPACSAQPPAARRACCHRCRACAKAGGAAAPTAWLPLRALRCFPHLPAPPAAPPDRASCACITCAPASSLLLFSDRSEGGREGADRHRRGPLRRQAAGGDH